VAGRTDALARRPRAPRPRIAPRLAPPRAQGHPHRRRHGGAYLCLKTLLRHKLVHHESQKYDGYRLTYMGYDFLAIKTLVNRGHIASVGRQIGVGKESDIFEVRPRCRGDWGAAPAPRSRPTRGPRPRLQQAPARMRAAGAATCVPACFASR
jgi:hypothetical protein